MAMVAAEGGQVSRAIPLIEHAIALEPSVPEYLAQYARLLFLLRRDGEAAVAVQRALAGFVFAGGPPQDPRTLDTIGCVLARLGDHEGSMPVFESAVAGEAGNLDYRFNLATACGFTGRVEAARSHYEAILAAEPGHSRAHYALSILSRQTNTDNHVTQLRSAIARASAPPDAVRLRYALAKELEDIGEHAEAFDVLIAANTTHKRSTGYDFAQDEAVFDAIEAAFAGAPAAPQAPAEGPIFVIGMPRTGTTLVDRILSSHPQVFSAGELQAMPLAIKQAAGTPSRRVIDPETSFAAMAVPPREIGRLYQGRAAHHLPESCRTGESRFVDKLPANFLNVGHILRALPGARVVCLRRHPMDTVWSNVRNLFATGSGYYAYSYDLMDTARYYARFDRLMAFWEHLYPGRVLQFDYEALVADQEPATRTLLEHCGLSWDAACLTFHQNRAAVATPSAAQVRRPLNADGIGRWRRHAEGMAQVRAFFQSLGITTD